MYAFGEEPHHERKSWHVPRVIASVLTFVDEHPDKDSRNLSSSQLDSYPGSKPGSKQRCARCEPEVQLPAAGHKCSSHKEHDPDLDREFDQELEQSESLDACPHVARVSCSYCKHIPLFPNRIKTTKLRIRRIVPEIDSPIADNLEQYDMRNHNEWPWGHFVAVPYCWNASLGEGPPDGQDDPYTVVEEDGSMRKIRASKQTIDRTVKFAAENGYRMIWIDQVSLPSLRLLSIRSDTFEGMY